MKRIDRLPYFAPSVLSLKMNTLFKCYHEYPKIATFWQEGNAFACVFGGKVTVVGKADWGDLQMFARFIGAKETEVISDSGYTVLMHDCKTNRPCTLIPSNDFNKAHEIICTVDQSFKVLAPRLEFIADMTIRTRNNCARTFINDDTVALITAEDEEFCLLGVLARDPLLSKKGSGKKMVEEVISDCSTRGKALYVIAENDKLAKFYENCGFYPISKVLDLKSW